MEKLRRAFEFIFASYKRTAAILFIGALTLAIPITISLVGQQQDLRQRAADCSTEGCSSGTCVLEYINNNPTYSCAQNGTLTSGRYCIVVNAAPGQQLKPELCQSGYCNTSTSTCASNCGNFQCSSTEFCIATDPEAQWSPNVEPYACVNPSKGKMVNGSYCKGRDGLAKSEVCISTYCSGTTFRCETKTTTNPPPATTFRIQGYKVMGNNQPGEPGGSQTVSLSGAATATLTSNPYFFTDLPSGNTYTVSVNPLDGYDIGYTLCNNSTGCHNDSPTMKNSVQVSLTTGYVDLWWHYKPKLSTIQGYKVLPNLQPGAAVDGQTITLSGPANSTLTSNPYFFTNLTTGTYTVSVNPLNGYDIGYTLCSPGTTTCHTGTPTPGTTVQVALQAGKFADLWWHYTPKTQNPPPDTSCPLKSQGDRNCDGHITIDDFNTWVKDFLAKTSTIDDFNTWVSGYLNKSLPH